MTTKRGVRTGARVLTLTAFALSVAAAPVAAAVQGGQPAGQPADMRTPCVSTTAFSSGTDRSYAGLAGTASVFLALGFGSVTIAHRRRWRDLSETKTSTPVRVDAELRSV